MTKMMSAKIKKFADELPAIESSEKQSHGEFTISDNRAQRLFHPN